MGFAAQGARSMADFARSAILEKAAVPNKESSTVELQRDLAEVREVVTEIRTGLQSLFRAMSGEFSNWRSDSNARFLSRSGS